MSEVLETNVEKKTGAGIISREAVDNEKNLFKRRFNTFDKLIDANPDLVQYKDNIAKSFGSDEKGRNLSFGYDKEKGIVTIREKGKVRSIPDNKLEKVAGTLYLYKSNDYLDYMLGHKQVDAAETEKSPELEKENYKIDKELSVDKKLVMGWTKEVFPAMINGIQKNVMVLKKQIDGQRPDAFVREYIDDGNIPKSLIGEQLFNRGAVMNLGLGGKLPNYEHIKAIGGLKENDQDFSKNNFQKDGEILLTGSRDSKDGGFHHVSKFGGFWLSDDTIVQINTNGTTTWGAADNGGFSLRLLK